MLFILRRFVQLSNIIFLKKRRQQITEVGSKDERRALNIPDETEFGEEAEWQRTKAHVDQERACEMWREFSEYIDKWCFLLFYVLKIALPLICLSLWFTRKEH
jgi:hypothetical protein